MYRPLVTADDARAVRETVRDGWISGAGPAVAELERRFAAYCGAHAGAATSSGTGALEVALTALGIGPGDEVICPSLTIISCARAILAVGATPVFVDVDPASWVLDVDRALDAIGPRTRAVLAVHLFGNPVALGRLLPLRDRGIHVVEDAAQAIGSEISVGDRWMRCGGAGDLGVFSFYANKAITTGEGGMVVGSDDALVERARRAASLFFGSEERFVHAELGHNYRMNGMGAALGLSQLARIDEIVARKRAVARAYREALSLVGGLRFAEPGAGTRPVPWMAAVVAEEIEARVIIEDLDARGIEARPFFTGMHVQPALVGRDVVARGRFDETERLTRHGLYLPSSLTLSEADVSRVASALAGALKRGIRPGRRSSNGCFGAEYARRYDAIYAGKPYEAEIRAIVSALSRYGDAPCARILDLGCGTGRHAAALASAGMAVTGVDRSREMLALAEARCRGTPGVRLSLGDLRELSVQGPPHDAALLLFAVLGYLGDDEEVARALAAIRRHLRAGALLIADVWDEAAVLAEPPSRREVRFESDGDSFVRLADPAHDPDRNIVVVRYRIRDGGGRTICDEVHPMRYFDEASLRSVLARASFELVRFGAWPELAEEGRSYTSYLVARAS